MHSDASSVGQVKDDMHGQVKGKLDDQSQFILFSFVSAIN